MFVCDEDTIAHQDEQIQIGLRFQCNTWGCPKCAPRRKRKLAAEATRGNPSKFLTLTCAPRSGETPDAMAVRMSRAWPRLARKMARKLRIKTIPFFLVFERHKSGYPHLHILMRCEFIKQKLLSQYWLKESGSRGVHIEDVRKRRNIVDYLAKYLGKDPHLFKGTKRYWKSQDWCSKLVKEPRPKMFRGHRPKIIPERTEVFVQRIVCQAWRFIELRPGYAVAISPKHHEWGCAP